MGACVPAGIRGSFPAAPDFSRCADCGADGDRGRSDARGHRRATLCRQRGDGRARVRPAEHQADRRGQARLEAAAARLREDARRKERHRLLPVAEKDGGDGRVSRRSGHPRAALSRRDEQGAARSQPEQLHDRALHGDGGDDRVRHGDRQIRTCASCSTPICRAASKPIIRRSGGPAATASPPRRICCSASATSACAASSSNRKSRARTASGASSSG